MYTNVWKINENNLVLRTKKSFEREGNAKQEKKISFAINYK